MTDLPTSVVIASHGRPGLLRRCLTGVSQLFHPDFEVIVVADAAGLAAVADLPFADAIKQVRSDEENLSAARNLGIAEAAGEVVAFIDDDAVPEPTWLDRLSGAFADADVAAATGFVRARNGISFQWQAETVDRVGTSRPLPLDTAEPTVLTPRADRAIKTPGTNMAFRRGLLAALGGFDPALRFYLDDADLNMRLAEAGALTAVVPLAQVHHAFAASSRRSAARAPRALDQIGASMAVYLRKHAPAGQHELTRRSALLDQRRRLLRHMQAGTLEPRDVRRLLREFSDGWAQGMRRPLDPLPKIARSGSDFRRFPSRPNALSVLIPARSLDARYALAEAQARVARGEVATVIILSRTALYHRVTFDPEGYWVQRGGIWGRSDRAAPLIRPMRFASRVQAECRRVAALRRLDCDAALHNG